MAEKTKTKNKLRLNIIDFLIALAVIGAIVGVALRAGIVEKVVRQSSLERARISFILFDIQEASADYFTIGDEFEAVSLDCKLGELESRQFMPAEAFVPNAKGELMKTHSADKRIDVRGTIIGEGVFTDEGFLLDGVNFIAPNSSIMMKSQNISVWITVTDIEKIESEKSEK